MTRTTGTNFLEIASREIAPGICSLYESIRTATDRTLLKKSTDVCDRALPALIQNPKMFPALAEYRLTPVDLHSVGASPFAMLDGILSLVVYPTHRDEKMLLLEYVFAGDQMWRRGFQK